MQPLNFYMQRLCLGKYVHIFVILMLLLTCPFCCNISKISIVGKNKGLFYLELSCAFKRPCWNVVL